MATQRLTDDQLLEALRLYSEYGNVTVAAKMASDGAGLPRPTFQHRLSEAKRKFGTGEALGSDIDGRLAPGFELKGYSQLTRTEAGEPIWLKTRRAERDYWAGIQSALSTLEPVPSSILPLPTEPQSDIIPWLQIGDAHIGMLASEAETGANFDISIAEREICAAAAALIDAAPECERMVVNDLGDGTHYETFKAETEASGNRQDYDTRYWKMVDAYIRITQFIVERAMTKAKVVDYIANQGNHSRSNDIWIAAFVRAIYGPTGRVNVLKNQSPIIAYRMGKTLVVIHHGDKLRPEKFRDIVATDYAADWGETEFRYLDGGHVHHSQRKELNGCIFESWNNLAPVDKWAHDSGYRPKACMSLVLRSRNYGETERRIMPIDRVRDIIRARHPDHYVPPQRKAYAA